MALNSQLFMPINWEKSYPMVKWTTKHVFFTGVALEIAVSVNWCATLGDLALDLVGTSSFEGFLCFVHSFG